MPEQLPQISAGIPQIGSTTESEEMYLITVARAVEEGTAEPVPIAAIAAELAVSAASVNEMVRKLADRGLVDYEPYHGVRLTGRGRSVAHRVLRSRRLWATFLADHLGFSPQEADEQACELEHVTQRDAADRLAAFLGGPEADPLGRPIPAAVDAAEHHDTHARLTTVDVGAVAEVVSIEGPPRTLAFLGSEGIITGARLTVLGSGSSGMLVHGAGPVHLSHEVAEAILVRP